MIANSYGVIGWHLPIRIDSMFKTVQFPCSIAHLATGLADVNGKNFSLEEIRSTFSFLVMFNANVWLSMYDTFYR